MILKQSIKMQRIEIVGVFFDNAREHLLRVIKKAATLKGYSFL